MFITVSHVHPSLIFAGKTDALKDYILRVSHRLGCKYQTRVEVIVVDQLTHNPKLAGSNPASARSGGRKTILAVNVQIDSVIITNH